MNTLESKNYDKGSTKKEDITSSLYDVVKEFCKIKSIKDNKENDRREN